MRRDLERLQDILEAIERIQGRVDLSKIEDDEMLQVWVLYHLQIIGEATRALSSQLKQNYSQIPCNILNVTTNTMSYQTTKLNITENISDQTRDVLVFLCHEANNLWNTAVYQIRQNHFATCGIREFFDK